MPRITTLSPLRRPITSSNTTSNGKAAEKNFSRLKTIVKTHSPSSTANMNVPTITSMVSSLILLVCFMEILFPFSAFGNVLSLEKTLDDFILRPDELTGC